MELKWKLVNMLVGKTKCSVLINPGQAQSTVGMALGYGRTKAGKAGDNVGFNAFPFLNVKLVGMEI